MLSVHGSDWHDDVITSRNIKKRYWTFLRGIHRSPVNPPHKGQWRKAFIFSLICAWINRWENNGEAGDFRCYRAHYDVTVMDPIMKTFSALLSLLFGESSRYQRIHPLMRGFDGFFCGSPEDKLLNNNRVVRNLKQSWRSFDDVIVVRKDFQSGHR